MCERLVSDSDFEAPKNAPYRICPSEPGPKFKVEQLPLNTPIGWRVPMISWSIVEQAIPVLLFSLNTFVLFQYHIHSRMQ
jgi:hypothetical protein